MNASERRWIKRLTDPDAGERTLAAFELFGRPLSEALQLAIRSLLLDAESQVKDMAGQTLGEAGDLEALPLVIAALASAPPSELRGAAWGLARLAELHPVAREPARKALLRYLARARGRTRVHASTLLERFPA